MPIGVKIETLIKLYEFLDFIQAALAKYSKKHPDEIELHNIRQNILTFLTEANYLTPTQTQTPYTQPIPHDDEYSEGMSS